MIFRCQDVFLALPVLMCAHKKLQLTASALTERARVGEMVSFPERKKRRREKGREKGIKQAISASRPDAPMAIHSPDPAPSIGNAENSPWNNGDGGLGGAAPCHRDAQIQAVLPGFSPPHPHSQWVQ